MKKFRGTRYGYIAKSNYPKLDELEEKILAQQKRLDELKKEILKIIERGKN